MEKEQIENEFGKVIKEFSIPHLNWDMDGKGWICESKTKKDFFGKNKEILILTNHGAPYIATKTELKKQIKILSKYIHGMESASYYL